MKTKMFQVAEGEYDCEIVEITSEMDGKARRVITWTLTILGGQYDGIVIEKKYYLVNKAVWAFLMKELKMLGIEPKTESDFAKLKTQAYGKHARISAVMNDQGFMAYYLKEVLDKKESQVAVGEQAPFSFGTD